MRKGFAHESPSPLARAVLSSGRLSRRLLGALILVVARPLLACDTTPFTPPDWPAHDRSEDGYLHARGLKYPFLCPAGADPAHPEVLIECAPRVRTASVAAAASPTDDAFLSCDALGCHGGYEYRERGALAAGRHLLGSEGPSCFACHDRKWEKTEPKTGTAKPEGGERDDDD